MNLQPYTVNGQVTISAYEMGQLDATDGQPCAPEAFLPPTLRPHYAMGYLSIQPDCAAAHQLLADAYASDLDVDNAQSGYCDWRWV
jgi:hypothetical protein